MAEWRQSTSGFVGDDAVEAGKDPITKESLFIGRFNWGGGLVPGKIIHSHGCCYIPYNGEEIKQTIYEYLIKPQIGFLSWKPASDGEICPGAIVGGRTENNETLYIGRAMENGGWIPGAIQQSQKCLRIPVDGKELRKTQYEVLIINYN